MHLFCSDCFQLSATTDGNMVLKLKDFRADINFVRNNKHPSKVSIDSSMDVGFNFKTLHRSIEPQLTLTVKGHGNQCISEFSGKLSI